MLSEYPIVDDAAMEVPRHPSTVAEGRAQQHSALRSDLISYALADGFDGHMPSRASSGTGRIKAVARRLYRKLALAVTSTAGAVLISVLSLNAILVWRGAGAGLLLEVNAVSLLIRAMYSLSRGPRPVLNSYRPRRKPGAVLTEEAKLSIAFLAASYVLIWPIDRISIGLFLFVNLAGQLAMATVGRSMLRGVARMNQKSEKQMCGKRVLVVGTGPMAKRAADIILDSPETDTALIGFLDYKETGLWRYRDVPLIGHPSTLAQLVIVNQIDALLLALEPNDLPQSSELFFQAEQMGVPILVMPSTYYPTISRTSVNNYDGVPVLVYRSSPENRFALFAKDIFDRAAALLGLLLVSPIFLLTALAIKLDSKGPVFFRQRRSGLNGRSFDMYKFRSMCVRAEDLQTTLGTQNEQSGPAFKIRRDPRITRLGRFLRKYSIDELPQLLNVIKGDMSLVGPRPPVPNEVSKYQPWQRRRLSMKPGLTCIWQVEGRNRVSFDEWMEMDLRYIDNWSLLTDIQLLAKTLPTVVKGTGM